MNWFWSGLLLVAAGGAMQGSFALPQKFIRGWAWEKTWLFYSLAGMIVFPWLLVGMVVPEAGAVYANAGAAVIGRTALFGLGWGLGSVLFGLGIARVGMALGFAIIISLTAAVGSLVPLAVQHPGQLLATRGLLLMLGLAIVVVGVLLCARAGALKEAALRQAASGGGLRGGLSAGLIICVASGLTSPMMNFSFAFGKPIAEEAVRHGATAANASIAIFAIAIGAGFWINAGYCVYLLARNTTWRGSPTGIGARNLLYAAAMGFLWLFGFFLYGVGATQMGEYGSAIGWPLFMMLMVLCANLWSLVTGEWKGAGARALKFLAAGMAVLLIALAVIAAGARS